MRFIACFERQLSLISTPHADTALQRKSRFHRQVSKLESTRCNAIEKLASFGHSQKRTRLIVEKRAIGLKGGWGRSNEPGRNRLENHRESCLEDIPVRRRTSPVDDKIDALQPA